MGSVAIETEVLTRTTTTGLRIKTITPKVIRATIQISLVVTIIAIDAITMVASHTIITIIATTIIETTTIIMVIIQAKDRKEMTDLPMFEHVHEILLKQNLTENTPFKF